MNVFARIGLVLLCVLSLVAMLAPLVNAAITYETKTYVVPGVNFLAARFYGFNLSSMPGATSPWIAGIYCYNSSAALLFNVSSGTFIQNSTSGTMSTSGSWFFWNTTPDNTIGLVPGNWYYAMCGRYETGYTSMYAGEINSNANYTNGTYFQIKRTAMTWDGSFSTGNSMYSAQAIMFGNGTASSPSVEQTLTISLKDIVDASTVSGFCVDIQSTNTTTSSQYLCNTTGSSITTNVTFASGNISFVNITDGHSSPTYFNATNTSFTFTSSTSLVGFSYQANLDMSATRLYLNTTITTLNVTNGLTSNTTATAPVRIRAVNGSNNVEVKVTGNYTVNVTCTVTTPLSTATCTAPGFYDNKFTLGANFVGASVASFNITTVNTTIIDTLNSTTTHALIMPLLQGYWYNFSIDAPGYALDTIALPANTSTNLHNFSLYVRDTFNMVFLNETTQASLNGVNVTVQLISDSYAVNYTTNNGTLIVSLLVPDDYTIRYWITEDEPRDYYTTLTTQSYQNLTLYVLDPYLSEQYIPTVFDENSRPFGGVKLQLLRYFINSNSYEVVEMTKTDSNGIGSFFVVPNYINYKLFMIYDGHTTTTDPMKIIDGTNTFVFSLSTSALTSIITIPNSAVSLYYVNSTQTYVFSWSDLSNIINEGCLYVQKRNSTGTHDVSSQCDDGNTGSLLYTITDTNETSYTARATIGTDTEFSEYGFGPLTVSFSSALQSWGLVGVIIMLVVIGTLGFMANEQGTDSLIITSVLGLGLLGLVGVITYRWETLIGIAIIGGILIYKTKG